jgi:hypothetical protein
MNRIDPRKLTHESFFFNCRCSSAVHFQPTTLTSPYVWYRKETYATFRLRIGSGTTELCHIKVQRDHPAVTNVY